MADSSVADRRDTAVDSDKPLILITGSGGFIGGALIDRLKGRARIVGMDLHQPETPAAGFASVRVDLTEDDSVREALATVRERFGDRVASVVHLAAYYDLSGEADPKYRSVTVEGTRRLLDRLRRDFAVEQFVYASTMLVHAPTEPGRPIDEGWPLEPKWPYPQSKVDTEAVVHSARGEIPVAVLRLAGIYDERCRSAFLAQQIARINERRATSMLFAGDPTHGQPSLHVEDLADAVERLVERRRDLPEDTVLLLGEAKGPSYEDLQQRIGELVHGRPWPVFSLPKPLVRAGAWAQEDVLDQDPFIQPWMMGIADDHYELDTSRARALLGWAPRRSLTDTLPAMVEALKRDPPSWYKDNKLNPALVAAVESELEEAEERSPPGGPELRAAEEARRRHRARTVWAHLANIALGVWLASSPFTFGLFDPAGSPPVPPASGFDLPAPGVRDAWLGWSEVASGLAVAALSALALARRGWAAWCAALVGVWLLFAPLVFWTTSAAAYANDTLVGMLVIVFAVVVPPQPGIGREALASDADVPLGWSSSPSSWVQRAPIVALAFVGLFVSRYLGAYQLGHIDGLWDPFFGGRGGLNGSETVVTSAVSKAFPIADAGFGAVAYALDILTGAAGDQRRWRTMPWLVLLFGLLIVPLGAVSVFFIVVQPTVIGALCSLCVFQAAITVVLIPFSVDEVLATAQFLWRSRRVGRPFWRTFLRGGAGFGEARDPQRGLDMPFGEAARGFLTSGVTYPPTLLACALIGAALPCTPLLLGTAPPLYSSDHVVGCVAVVLAVTAWAEVARAVRLLVVPLGAWVAASPFWYGEGDTVSVAAHVAAGLALAVLALPRGKRSRDHYGGWDRYIL